MSKTEYTSCEGLKFVVTGKLKVFANREELIDYIESEGGVVGSSVTSKTNYLINNDFESQSGKNKKAKELNIQIITEKQFLDMFGENYIEKDEDEPSNMISVKCPDADKKDLEDLLMCAYTEMILNGMGIGVLMNTYRYPMKAKDLLKHGMQLSKKTCVRRKNKRIRSYCRH